MLDKNILINRIKSQIFDLQLVLKKETLTAFARELLQACLYDAKVILVSIEKDLITKSELDAFLQKEAERMLLLSVIK